MENYGVLILFVLYLLSSFVTAFSKQAKKRRELGEKGFEFNEPLNPYKPPVLEKTESTSVFNVAPSSDESLNSVDTGKKQDHIAREFAPIQELELNGAIDDQEDSIWKWASDDLAETINDVDLTDEGMSRNLEGRLVSMTSTQQITFSKEDLKKGIILSEVLSLPRSLNPYKPRRAIQ